MKRRSVRLVNIADGHTPVRHDAVLRHLCAEFPAGIPREIMCRVARASIQGQAVTLDTVDEWIAQITDATPIAASEPAYRTGYERQAPAVVYYLRFGAMVKIGTTVDLHTRMQQVPHDELLATEAGSYETERLRHAQFRALRHHHEWFRYEGPLVGHVQSLRDAQ